MELADRDLAAAVLRRQPWLAEGRQALVAPLLAHGRIVRLGAGEWAHAEGDDVAGVTVVLAGAAGVFAEAPGGRQVLLNIAGAGTALGQTARFGGGPRLVTVICREPSVLLQVSDHALSRIAAETPRIWEAVAALNYLQLRAVLHWVAQAAALPPRQRLAARLEAMAGDGAVAISQEGLGEMVGLSRKTVNGHLGAFEKAGLVRRAYGRVEVLDARGLRRVAER